MRTKICTKCGLEKPTSEFNKNKLKKDGLQSECRDCHK
jgi:L-lactate utilization protein LutC